MNSPQGLYETDFLLWTKTHVNLLKQGKFSEVDVSNLIEEVESIGKGEKRELRSRLIILLMHTTQMEISTPKTQ